MYVKFNRLVGSNLEKKLVMPHAQYAPFVISSRTLKLDMNREELNNRHAEPAALLCCG